MNINTKKRFSVNVSGVSLKIVTDEGEDFVKSTAASLSHEIDSIIRTSFCITKLDAAILTALEAKGEIAKAEAKIEELETELKLLRSGKESSVEAPLQSPSHPEIGKLSPERRQTLERFLDGKING